MDTEVVADVLRDETASSADMVQPLDLISLAIEAVDATPLEKKLLRQSYRDGEFHGAELECQNEHQARELVQSKLDQFRDRVAGRGSSGK